MKPVGTLSPEEESRVRAALAKGIRPESITLPKKQGESKSDRYSSKWERMWAYELDCRVRDGTVRRWRYEAIKLCTGEIDGRLRFYWPDFLVVMADGTVQLHEVKGFFRDDAKEKIASARREYGDIYRFVLVTRSKAGWKETVI